jgi:hypothetical protein
MINQKYLILYKRKHNILGAELLQFATGSIIMKKKLEIQNLYCDPFLNYDRYLITWNIYWEIKELKL